MKLRAPWRRGWTMIKIFGVIFVKMYCDLRSGKFGLLRIMYETKISSNWYIYTIRGSKLLMEFIMNFFHYQKKIYIYIVSWLLITMLYPWNKIIFGLNFIYLKAKIRYTFTVLDHTFTDKKIRKKKKIQIMIKTELTIFVVRKQTSMK